MHNSCRVYMCNRSTDALSSSTALQHFASFRAVELAGAPRDERRPEPRAREEERRPEPRAREPMPPLPAASQWPVSSGAEER